MRKISLITTMAFSTLVFAALLSCIPIPVVHAAYPDPVNACMCDHWNEEQHDTEYDIFTATGVTAYYSSPQTFDHADFWFSCGTGGYYMYHPSYPMGCYWKYAQSLWSWFGPYYYAYYGSYTYPYHPWQGSYDYYGREYLTGHYFSWASYVGGLTTNYFQYPPNPSTYVMIGNRYAIAALGG